MPESSLTYEEKTALFDHALRAGGEGEGLEQALYQIAGSTNIELGEFVRSYVKYDGEETWRDFIATGEAAAVISVIAWLDRQRSDDGYERINLLEESLGLAARNGRVEIFQQLWASLQGTSNEEIANISKEQLENEVNQTVSKPSKVISLPSDFTNWLVDAGRNGHGEMAEYLLDWMHESNLVQDVAGKTEGFSTLFKAFAEGNQPAGLKRLLALYEANVETDKREDYRLWGALMKVTEKGHLEAYQVVADYCLRNNRPDLVFGSDALENASASGNVDLVQEVLKLYAEHDKGSPPFLDKQIGKSVTAAAVNGKVETLELLLDTLEEKGMLAETLLDSDGHSRGIACGMTYRHQFKNGGYFAVNDALFERISPLKELGDKQKENRSATYRSMLVQSAEFCDAERMRLTISRLKEVGEWQPLLEEYYNQVPLLEAVSKAARNQNLSTFEVLLAEVRAAQKLEEFMEHNKEFHVFKQSFPSISFAPEEQKNRGAAIFLQLFEVAKETGTLNDFITSDAAEACLFKAINDGNVALLKPMVEGYKASPSLAEISESMGEWELKKIAGDFANAIENGKREAVQLLLKESENLSFLKKGLTLAQNALSKAYEHKQFEIADDIIAWGRKEGLLKPMLEHHSRDSSRVIYYLSNMLEPESVTALDKVLRLEKEVGISTISKYEVFYAFRVNSPEKVQLLLDALRENGSLAECLAKVDNWDLKQVVDATAEAAAEGQELPLRQVTLIMEALRETGDLPRLFKEYQEVLIEDFRGVRGGDLRHLQTVTDLAREYGELGDLFSEPVFLYQTVYSSQSGGNVDILGHVIEASKEAGTLGQMLAYGEYDSFPNPNPDYDEKGDIKELLLAAARETGQLSELLASRGFKKCHWLNQATTPRMIGVLEETGQLEAMLSHENYDAFEKACEYDQPQWLDVLIDTAVKLDEEKKRQDPSQPSVLSAMVKSQDYLGVRHLVEKGATESLNKLCKHYPQVQNFVTIWEKEKTYQKSLNGRTDGYSLTPAVLAPIADSAYDCDIEVLKGALKANYLVANPVDENARTHQQAMAKAWEEIDPYFWPELAEDFVKKGESQQLVAQYITDQLRSQYELDDMPERSPWQTGREVFPAEMPEWYADPKYREEFQRIYQQSLEKGLKRQLAEHVPDSPENRQKVFNILHSRVAANGMAEELRRGLLEVYSVAEIAEINVPLIRNAYEALRGTEPHSQWMLPKAVGLIQTFGNGYKDWLEKISPQSLSLERNESVPYTYQKIDAQQTAELAEWAEAVKLARSRDEIPPKKPEFLDIEEEKLDRWITKNVNSPNPPQWLIDQICDTEKKEQLEGWAAAVRNTPRGGEAPQPPEWLSSSKELKGWVKDNLGKPHETGLPHFLLSAAFDGERKQQADAWLIATVAKPPQWDLSGAPEWLNIPDTQYHHHQAREWLWKQSAWRPQEDFGGIRRKFDRWLSDHKDNEEPTLLTLLKGSFGENAVQEALLKMLGSGTSSSTWLLFNLLYEDLPPGMSVRQPRAGNNEEEVEEILDQQQEFVHWVVETLGAPPKWEVGNNKRPEWLEIPEGGQPSNALTRWLKQESQKSPYWTRHDAAQMFDAESDPQEMQGFATWLLKNYSYQQGEDRFFRPRKELETIAAHWAGFSEKECPQKFYVDLIDGETSAQRQKRIADREPPATYQSLLTLCRSKKFKRVKDVDFAIEAASHPEVKESDYPDIEAIYLRGQGVPEPFDTSISFSHGGLTGRFLPRSDPRVGFFGAYTGCCQHFGGVGAACAESTITDEFSQLFVVEDKNGRIIAGSWIWENTDEFPDPQDAEKSRCYKVACFDNIEACRDLPSDKLRMIREIYDQAAGYLAHEAGYRQVTVGTGQGLQVYISDLPDTRALPLPKAYGAGGYIDEDGDWMSGAYTDADNQRLFAENVNAPYLTPRKIAGVVAEKITQENCSQELFNQIQSFGRNQFPEGWELTEFGDPEDMVALAVREEGSGEMLGAAWLNNERRAVENMVAKMDPATGKRLGAMDLYKNILDHMREQGGQWRADVRDANSMRFLELMNQRGHINMTTHDEKSLNGETYYVVTIEVPERKQTAELPKGEPITILNERAVETEAAMGIEYEGAKR